MRTGIAFFLALIGVYFVALATEPPQVRQQTLQYGETVTGEITDVAYEAGYTFTGTAGDVIVAEMRSLDRSLLNALIAPNLILRDPDNNVIVNTAATYPIDDSTLIARLPQDGDYLLIATREAGPNGGSIGAFSLSLKLAQRLPTDTILNQDIAVSDGPIYYSADADEPVTLHFRREAGDYAPRVSLNEIDVETGRLVSLAYGGGANAREFCLVTQSEQDVVVIALEPDDNVFAFEDVNLVFALHISHAQCATTG